MYKMYMILKKILYFLVYFGRENIFVYILYNLIYLQYTKKFKYNNSSAIYFKDIEIKCIHIQTNIIL